MSKNQSMVDLIGEGFVFQAKQNVIIIVVPLAHLVGKPHLRGSHRIYAMILHHNYIWAMAGHYVPAIFYTLNFTIEVFFLYP